MPAEYSYGPMKHPRIFHSLFCLALVLVLSLRVVAAPFIMASPAPGIMAICAGGEIIYISMEDGQPVDDDSGFDAEPCPFFGIMSMLADVHPPDPAPVALSVLEVRPLAGHNLPSGVIPSAYRSRAPPALV